MSHSTALGEKYSMTRKLEGFLILSAVFFSSTAAAQSVDWKEITADESGLSHTLNSDSSLGNIDYPWMSPLVDLNADGYLDLMVYGHHGGGAAIWFGAGDGKFSLDPSGYTSRWVFYSRDPLWWDANNDGHIDGSRSNYENNPWGSVGGLLLNDGDGMFVDSGVSFYGIISDFDGDGLHQEGWESRTLPPKLGTFSSPFASWSGAPPEDLEFQPVLTVEDLIGFPEGVERGNGNRNGPGFHHGAAMDLDGDNWNELVVRFQRGNTTPRLVSWVMRRDPDVSGVAGWVDVTAEVGLPTGLGHAYFPEDIDIDGDLDMIDLATGFWYTNDGGGRFTKVQKRIYDPSARSLGAPWTGDGEFEFLDFDNNGYRDIVFGADHDVASGLFLNTGGGNFVEYQDSPLPTNRRNRKFADIDGDHDLDLVVMTDRSGTDAENLTFYRNDEETNHGFELKLLPRVSSLSYLGAKIWIYEAGELGNTSALVQYRQCFMERQPERGNVLLPSFHVGIGTRDSVDIRVRFATGVVAEATGVQKQSSVEIAERGRLNVVIDRIDIVDSVLQIRVKGSAEEPFIIYRSDNLGTWENMGQFSVPAGGTSMVYEAPIDETKRRLFYRLNHLP